MKYVPNTDFGNRENKRYMSLEEKFFVNNRTIFIRGEIDTESAQLAVMQITDLAKESNEDIILRINSPGGSVSDGLAILDTMNAAKTKCNVVTIASGMAASMAAVLLSGGTKGKRYCTPMAEVMIHQPLGGIKGQSSDISIAAEHISNTKHKLVDILAKNTNQDVEKLMVDMERDHWLSAEQAMEYGITDGIMNELQI